MNTLTAQEAIAELDSLNGPDHEAIHGDADDALLAFVALVAPEVAEAFESCRERTAPWWYA